MASPTKYFCIVIAVSFVVTFATFNKIKLTSIHRGDLLLNQYTDASRYNPWEKVIQETGDEFLIYYYGKKNPQETPFANPYAYTSVPGYILYKVFHAKGEQLWLIESFLTSLFNIATTLMVFGIANCLFGTRVAFISAILCSFAPHIWIMYNFYVDVRGYNTFWSLLTVFLFLRYEQKGDWPYLIGSGASMGINFLFFHMGSFVIPIVIIIYCALRSLLERTIVHSKKIITLVLIAASVTLVIDYAHSAYFRIQQGPVQAFFEFYAQRESASHKVQEMVLFDINRLIENIGLFFNSVFINGIDKDRHFLYAPPEIPLIYSYFVSAFSIPGMWALCRKKRKENIFLLTWLLFFILVYSLVIEVRIKNLFLLIPPFMILAAYGSEISIRHVIRLSQRLKFQWPWIPKLPAAILLTGSVLIGSYYIFIKIPGKNFYGGAGFMGSYQMYNHIKSRGYSSKTTIIFSQDAEHRPQMGLRLFTQSIPKFKSLMEAGIVAWPGGPPEAEKMLKMESELFKASDKIFYCFQHWTDYMGSPYVTSEQHRESFILVHPDLKPFVINGLDGKPLWRIYEVSGTNLG